MDKYNGQLVNVTATAQVVDIGAIDEWYTLLTEDANNVYYRGRTGNESQLDNAADAAALRALGCSELQRGEPIAVTGGQAEFVCVNAETSTLRVEAGIQIASVDASLTIGTVNSDLDTIGGTSVNVNNGVADNGTLVVNQASDGVNAAAFALITHIDAGVYSGGVDGGVGLVAVRKDTRALPGAATDGQYTSLQTNAFGELRVRDDDVASDVDTINTNTVPLVTSGGGGYIRQDSTATIAKETGGNLATIVTAQGNIEKGGKAESTSLSFAEFSNGTAMTPGSDVDALAIGGDVPFITANIQAQKLVSGATEPPIPNVGDVWICSALEDLTGAKRLSPGQSMDLHPNGNLNEYFCAVVNANDGLSITYTA
jgi:hypothetical protein